MKSSDIVFELPLKKSQEEIWGYWTTSAKLEQWLTVKANVEPKINGSYELFWEPENKHDNSTLGCKIMAFQPGRLLSFQWRGPVPYADIMNVEPFPTWVSISFEAVGINETILHFRHSGWGASEKSNEAKQWQTKAWEMAFAQLKGHCD